jgi:hypothetical protein
VISYPRYLAILAQSDAAVQQAAGQAFRRLLDLIRQGNAPRSAIDQIMIEFNADTLTGFREAFSAVLESSLGDWPVGGVKLSQRLYQNAQQVSATAKTIIEQHLKGLHNAQELRKALYEGYNFQQDPLNVIKPLPKYLQVEFDRFKAAQLKTPALRAAYLEAIRKAEAGAGMDAIEKKLRIAFYERNRYFANRIARTELHRAYTDQQARELMEQDRIQYVQIRLSSKHPKPDVCCRAGTLIITATGLKPIESVAIGDNVLTHRERWRPVTQLYQRRIDETDTLVQLATRTESRQSHQVTLTPNHPVLTDQGWIPVGDLKIGCRVFSSENVGFHPFGGDAFYKAPLGFLGSWITPGLKKVFSELCGGLLVWFPSRTSRMLHLCFSAPKAAHKIDGDISRHYLRLLSSSDFLTPSSISIDEGANQQNGETSPDGACHNLDYFRRLPACTRRSNIDFLCNWATQNFSHTFYRLKGLLRGLESNKRVSSIFLDCFAAFQKGLHRLHIEPLFVAVGPLRHKRESNKVDPSLLKRNRFDTAGKFSSLRTPVCNSYINYSIVLGKTIVKSRGETVFNLGVAGDQSYVAGGLVVHNCDYHAKVDLYGLGPGVYPKAEAPKPPFHPHCYCQTAPRIDLINPKPKFNPNAERTFLRTLPAKEAAQVAGSFEKRRRILEDKESLEGIYNEGKDEMYQWRRMGDGD